ncbi:MAG: ATP-binding protein [Candidatus Rokubacteria bacterium]|nr:ATP-binding protein [Candidatus Rokubacteria bacterium]
MDAEWAQREQRKVRSLATCAWIAQRRKLLLIGPTGVGKSWLGGDRAERALTLITSQVPVKGWHDLIGERTHADADSAASRSRTLLSTGPDLCPRCPA